MKRLLVLSLFVLGAAEHEEFTAAMKMAGSTMGPMMKSISAGQMADVEAGAKKLEAVFATSEKFWTAKKVADGTKWSQDAAAAAKALGAAAGANDAAAVKSSVANLAATCKGCHDVHREKLPDGTFRIK